MDTRSLDYGSDGKRAERHPRSCAGQAARVPLIQGFSYTNARHIPRAPAHARTKKPKTVWVREVHIYTSIYIHICICVYKMGHVGLRVCNVSICVYIYIFWCISR